VGGTVLPDKTGKISGACSIKSSRQSFSLYKPQKSGVNLGKTAVYGDGLSGFCRIFRYWRGGEYCTVLVRRHVPTQVVSLLVMALYQWFRMTF
jgi:hypothetical protein